MNDIQADTELIRRYVDEIRATGAAWVTEHELALLCDLATNLMSLKERIQRIAETESDPETAVVLMLAASESCAGDPEPWDADTCRCPSGGHTCGLRND